MVQYANRLGRVGKRVSPSAAWQPPVCANTHNFLLTLWCGMLTILPYIADRTQCTAGSVERPEPTVSPLRVLRLEARRAFLQALLAEYHAQKAYGRNPCCEPCVENMYNIDSIAVLPVFSPFGIALEPMYYVFACE